MNKCLHTELSSPEETRCEFNRGSEVIKLGIDVHQDFYTVVMQMGGANPKPPQRFQKEAFLHWVAKLKQSSRAEIHAVYEVCGFGFGLQRALSALGMRCQVVCPQKLDEANKRVKTDGLDAKALCLRLDRFVEGNRDALALVRVPSEQEEQLRAIHRQREQLVKARKQLEAQGRNFDGQSWDRTGKKLVEAEKICSAPIAPVDEGTALQQSTDPYCAAAADRRTHRATPELSDTATAAWVGRHEQRDYRSRDR
jgi:transposase